VPVPADRRAAPPPPARPGSLAARPRSLAARPGSLTARPAPRALARPSVRREGLLLPTGSPVHRLPPQTKLAALPAFAACVVAVPAGSWWALATCGVLLLAVVVASRLPVAAVARRMLVEAPVVVFALLLPVVATGPRVDVLGLELSRAGLLGGATLLVKATLGVLAAVVLAATTSSRDLLAGLERLHVPRTMVAILSFAVRYSAVLVQETRRLQVALAVRGGGRPRLRHLRAVAGGVGALFVRGYERGERVQRSMVVRGWTGALPALESSPASALQWAAAGSLPALALVVALTARAAA